LVPDEEAAGGAEGGGAAVDEVGGEDVAAAFDQGELPEATGAEVVGDEVLGHPAVADALDEGLALGVEVAEPEALGAAHVQGAAGRATS
tara:strand:+ start:853 stop:1119 length:267 start_codon:yes stop_codon:yes gene_type:complete